MGACSTRPTPAGRPPTTCAASDARASSNASSTPTATSSPPAGGAVAVLFTKAYGRVLGPGLAALDPGLPDDLSKRQPLATAWRTLDRALDRFINDGLAAA